MTEQDRHDDVFPGAGIGIRLGEPIPSEACYACGREVVWARDVTSARQRAMQANEAGTWTITRSQFDGKPITAPVYAELLRKILADDENTVLWAPHSCHPDRYQEGVL